MAVPAFLPKLIYILIKSFLVIAHGSSGVPNILPASLLAVEPSLRWTSEAAGAPTAGGFSSVVVQVRGFDNRDSGWQCLPCVD